MKKNTSLPRPTAAQVEAELRRMDFTRHYRAALKSTVCLLLTTAAAAVLAAVFLFPILRVSGSAMSPVLEEGDVVLCLKTDRLEPGDTAAFYHNNKLLLRQVTALPGEQASWNKPEDASLTVPEGHFFVLAQDPSFPDSRHEELGYIPKERILGKVLFRLSPLSRFGSIEN